MGFSKIGTSTQFRDLEGLSMMGTRDEPEGYLGWDERGGSLLEAPDGLQSPFPLSVGGNPSRVLSPWLIQDCKRQKIDLPTNASEEPSSILGLNLRKSPSLLNLIEARLSSESTPTTEKIRSPDSRKLETRTDDNVDYSMLAKLKASNFSAILIRIGCWERIAENEGDVVAKIYFYKQKLVWEILERGLKSKMEIQWSNITMIRAIYRDGKHDILVIELNEPPHFYHETNPQPRKHTNWEATSDFTGQQASIFRRHYLEFAEGTLARHYEKLLHSEPRLRTFSPRPFTSQCSPYFMAMQGYPYELRMRRSNFPLPHNQPSRNLQPSQPPRLGFPINHHHIGAFECLGPTIGLNTGIMATNSPSSVIEFPPIDERAPFVMDQISLHSANNFLINNAATRDPNVSPRRVTAIHHPSSTERVRMESELRVIAEHWLGDRYPPADGRSFPPKVGSPALLLSEMTQLDSQPQSFETVRDGGFDFDDAVSLAADLMQFGVARM